MSKVLQAIVQLRRDNEFNFEPIANSFVPANGEVVLIDTRRDGCAQKWEMVKLPWPILFGLMHVIAMPL